MTKVLVCTVGAWSNSVGFDTVSSLFKEYNKDDLACFYIRADLSDDATCYRFFHIYEGRVLKSVIKRGVETGEYFDARDLQNLDKHEDVNIEHKRFNFFKKHPSAFINLLREVMWKMGKWKSKSLDAFLDDFQPDVVFFPIEAYIHFNRIVNYIVKKTDAKAVAILYDDNFTYKFVGCNPFKIIHRFWLRSSVKEMVALSEKVFAFCPKMKRECDKRYGIDSILLSKPIINKGVYTEKITNFPVRMLYSGNLLYGRDGALMEVIECLAKVNREKVLISLDVYTGSPTPKLYTKHYPDCNFCIFHKPVPQSEIFKKQSEADVLLFVESMSNRYLNARLSFSTKLTDYFSAGKCILAVGNYDLGPIEYLKEEDAGLVCTNKGEIEKALETITTDRQVVAEYAKKSYDCGIRNHSAEHVFNLVSDTIEKVANGEL